VALPEVRGKGLRRAGRRGRGGSLLTPLELVDKLLHCPAERKMRINKLVETKNAMGKEPSREKKPKDIGGGRREEMKMEGKKEKVQNTGFTGEGEKRIGENRLTGRFWTRRIIGWLGKKKIDVV